MPERTPNIDTYISIAKPELQTIFDVLRREDYTLVGPTIEEGAIVCDEISELADLPVGWTDEQGPGSYRLKRCEEAGSQDLSDGKPLSFDGHSRPSFNSKQKTSYFSYVVGPQSWKRFLYPSQLKLFSVERHNGSFSVTADTEPVPKYAFIGVRSCDLHAIRIQDRIFLEGPYQEPNYKARRQAAFILAVNCTQPGQTCFCVSMHTGPKVDTGFDLALTELSDVFLLKVGSDLGAQIVANVNWHPAGAFELQSARQALAEAEQQMGRQMDTSDLPNLLYQNLDHPRWTQIGQRCLSCGNCTNVCPTCFCSDVVDVADLTGQSSERVRVWDSCFSLDYSHVHGGNIRPGTQSRYRQWLTHKLASWVDQFGILGCVGCGRCITWCPVGIDITEEVEAIRMETVQ